MYSKNMNYSVSCLPALTFHETKEENYTLYDAIVAAIGDINVTLPASQKIILSTQNFENTYCLYLSQKGIILCQYEIDIYPHIFRRIWTVITVGFIDEEKVEQIKNDITERYLISPIII